MKLNKRTEEWIETHPLLTAVGIRAEILEHDWGRDEKKLRTIDIHRGHIS